MDRPIYLVTLCVCSTWLRGRDFCFFYNWCDCSRNTATDARRMCIFCYFFAVLDVTAAPSLSSFRQRLRTYDTIQ